MLLIKEKNLENIKELIKRNAGKWIKKNLWMISTRGFCWKRLLDIEPKLQKEMMGVIVDSKKINESLIVLFRN